MLRGTAIALGIGLAALACELGCDRGARAVDDAGAEAIPQGATPVTPSTPPIAVIPPPAAAAGSVNVRLEPVSFAPIAHAADPSVVTINTVSEEAEESPFSHRRRPREMRGLGSGFVVDKGGVVLTNNHVIEGADQIEVKLFDEREFPGKVVATDPQTDIAVVRIDAKDLRALPLGDSDLMDVG